MVMASLIVWSLPLKSQGVYAREVGTLTSAPWTSLPTKRTSVFPQLQASGPRGGGAGQGLWADVEPGQQARSGWEG